MRDLENLKSIFNKYEPEFIFHRAAQSLVRRPYQNPKLTLDTNICGAVNVLEAIIMTTSVNRYYREKFREKSFDPIRDIVHYAARVFDGNFIVGNKKNVEGSVLPPLRLSSTVSHRNTIIAFIYFTVPTMLICKHTKIFWKDRLKRFPPFNFFILQKLIAHKHLIVRETS